MSFVETFLVTCSSCQRCLQMKLHSNPEKGFCKDFTRQYVCPYTFETVLMLRSQVMKRKTLYGKEFYFPKFQTISLACRDIRANTVSRFVIKRLVESL